MGCDTVKPQPWTPSARSCASLWGSSSFSLHSTWTGTGVSSARPRTSFQPSFTPRFFFLYFVYVGMRMYRGDAAPEREEKGVAILRGAERIVRPILYTAVAVEFIVYWPQNWCKESNALLGGCWPESDFSWWLLAVQVAIPDFLVFLALFPKGMRSLQALLHGEGAGSQSSFAAQAQGAAAPLLGKMHYF